MKYKNIPVERETDPGLVGNQKKHGGVSQWKSKNQNY